MNRIFPTIPAVAVMTLLALCSSTEAATISNFRQNPASDGLSASDGNLNITNVGIDYVFQVPPGNTGIGPVSSQPGTYPATLTISGNITVAALGGGQYRGSSIPLTFTIRGASGAGSLSGQVLLSGNLLAEVLVSTTSNTILLQGFGSNWNSQALYDVGGGPLTANFLQGQTFSMSLINLTGISVGSAGQLNFRSPGGSSITGNFAAVPEPASLVMMGLGLAGFSGVLALRKRFARA
ncbi:MAG: PEP-CTERM sorting domain-containing protein [Isosphaeraceae bacterium]